VLDTEALALEAHAVEATDGVVGIAVVVVLDETKVALFFLGKKKRKREKGKKNSSPFTT